MKLRNFLSLLLTLLLLLSLSVSSVFAEGTDFGVYTEAFLDLKEASLGAYSYQDMVTNFFAKAPGTGEEWHVITLSRVRKDINYEIYRTALLDYINSNDFSGATQLQKEALTYLAAGGDKENIANVVDDTVGALGMMSYVYGLHLLNNGAPSKLYTADDLVKQILSLEKAEGGWAIMGDYADIDTTAMTIQAIAPYYASNPDVKASVDKALDLLGSKQLEDGSYFSFGSANPEGTAQTILALCSIGIDPFSDERFIKNGNTLLDGILLFKTEDGTFSHTVGGTSNSTTTQQIMYCSAGYNLLKEGKTLFIFDGFEEPSEDSAKDIKHEEEKEKPGLKLYLYIASGIVFAAWIAVLIIKKRKSFNSYLSAILVLAAVVFLIHSVNIKSPDSYYNGENEIKGEAISCTLSINCSTVAGKKDFIPKDGVILDTVTIKIPKGGTAMDQITAAARLYKLQLDVKGSFVAGINYIYEKDFGDLSGWMYRVNGEYASTGAPEFVLKDGDNVEWLYTTNLGADIGDTFGGGE